MKTVLKISAAVLLALVAIAFTLSSLLSPTQLWQQVSSRVEAATGRPLQVEGDIALNWFPTLGLELNQIRFANAPGSTERDMLTAQKLTLALPWQTLWSALSGSGTLAVDSFVLQKPVLYLEKDAKGKANWQFLQPPAAASTHPAATKASTAATEAAAQQTSAEAVALPSVQLGDIRIEDGMLRYVDLQNGTEQLLSKLQLNIGLDSLQSPLKIKGEAEYLEKRQQLNLQLDNLAALLAHQPVRLQLDLENDVLDLALSGDYQQNLQGTVELSSPSLRDLLQWQGITSEADAKVLQAFSLKANLLWHDQELQLNDLSGELDGISLKGKQQLWLTSPLRAVGKLELGAVNLNPYLPAVAAGPAEKADKTRLQWSEEPLDLTALTQVELDQQLSVQALQFKEIKLGASKLQLKTERKVLSVRLSELQAYQGSGSGVIALDLKAKPYQLSTDFNLQAVAAEPLLTDAIGFNKLMGKGSLQWQLSSKGQSQRALIDNLAGTFSFRFQDGAVRGANIAAIVRSAGEAIKGNLAGIDLDKDFSESQSTDFSELSASLQFSQGLGSSSDLQLASPLLRLSGQGSVDLPAQQLDYVLTSQLVASIEGQGAKTDTKGLTIPVRVKGPWQALKIRPDISKAAKDKAKQKVEDKLKSKLQDFLQKQQ